MLIVDTLIINGVKWVLTKLADAVEAEMYDETALREELLAAQMRLELGEITDEEFGEIEEAVLAGMREVKERQKAAAGKPRGEDAPRVSGRAGERKFTIESIEANFDREEEPRD